ncbi:coiled-coil-helix-coiled-coil-helix domain-containing protein 1 [Clupea harengus]|uniref:Coiled-coil-helix-coiled-coil-helix domain-containing protein 1 n=1 Tax=Clupea harengus TaxID=7950 RepID=A0A6P3VWD3_CLUHA|nr:coiled-coil-helix-coiled-coil-helix domain-containing protein 1 [Clupea harengus]
MAYKSATALQEKVNRLMSRTAGKPVLKPNKPLVLKGEVANRKMRRGEATCITEMSLLMACWKKSEFNNTVCSSEITVFYKCVEKAQVEAKSKTAQQSSQGGRLVPKQANTLLKRFPSIKNEY